MTRRIALLILAATEALALTVVAVVCAALARDEDADGAACVCPGCDEGPDDLPVADLTEHINALKDAAAALAAPLSWELAKTPEVRAMTLVNSAAWLATARDIDTLPTYRGGR